jgi:hypothetical protein
MAKLRGAAVRLWVGLGVLQGFMVLPLQARAADELEALRQQMRVLADKMERLERERERERSATAAAAQTATPANVVQAGDLPGSFKIPGTNTSFKLGGFIAVEAVKELNGGGMFGNITSNLNTVPIEGSAQSSRSGQLTLSARRSRLQLLTLTRGTALGDVSGLVEADFVGAGGTEYSTNSSGLRLRLAYAKVGGWTFGQAYSTFGDFAAVPPVIDFNGGFGLPGAPRQALVRYETKTGPHEWAWSVENPEGDFAGATSGTLTAGGVGPLSTTALDKVPDVLGKYAYNGDRVRVAVAGVVRRLTLNNTGQAAINGFVGEASTTAGALAVQARVKTFGADALMLSVFGGPGVGRYGLNTAFTPNFQGTAAVVIGGKLDAVDQRGLNVGYLRYWTPEIRSTLSYGRVTADNPHPALPLNVLSKMESLYANVVWMPSKEYMFGAEWMRARVQNDVPAKGETDRLHLYGQYSF